MTSHVNSQVPARTACARQTGLGAALLIAPWFFVLANAAGFWETRHGGNDTSGADALALAAAHPGLDRFAMVTAMVGSLLMVPAVIGVMRLIGFRAARLSLIAGVLTAGAYIAYFAMNSGDRFQLAMVARGDTGAEYGKILDDSLNGASVVWYFLLFAIGSLVGTFLLGLALRRSRVVPTWAAVAVLGWSVLKIPEFMGVRIIEVVGSVVLAVGFAAVARELSRQPLATVVDPQVGQDGQYAPVVAVGVQQS
jgi:hypothetical protein